MRITFSAFLLLLFTRLYAQTTAAFTVLSVNEGLSQGMVFDILQRRDGYLWIATKDGLNRYDGYRFKIFAPDAFNPFSPASSEIRWLHEDSLGRLWAAYEGGFDISLKNTGRFFHLPLPKSEAFSGYVEGFAEKPDGAMWFVSNDGLWKIEIYEEDLRIADEANQPFPDFKFTGIEPTAGQSLKFNWVVFTKDQELLAATTDGLYRIEAAGDKFRLVQEALPGVVLNTLREDKEGRLWLDSEQGLWMRENGRMKLVDKTPVGHKVWRFDAPGNLWKHAGTMLLKWEPGALKNGLGKPSLALPLLDPSERRIAYYLTTLTVDHSGNVWLGTSGYGLLKVVTAKPKFLSYLTGTSHGVLLEDPSGNFFSLRYRQNISGGKQFDVGRPNPWVSEFPPGKDINLAVFDNQGNWWANCNDSTLCWVDAQTKEPRFFDWNSIGLFCTRNDRILGLNDESLLVFDPASEKTTAHPFAKPFKFNYGNSAFYNHFFEDEDGVIWIFDFEGLVKAVPAGQTYRFEYFKNDPKDRSSLSSNLILTVADDPLEPRRYLWVGTKGGGLNRLDKQSGKFQHFKVEDGLPDNVIYGILPDRDGNLWMSTNKGLCRMTIERVANARGQMSSKYFFKNFTAADGLQSNEFNRASFLKMKDGTMVFGGVNGLTAFHPDSLLFNQHVPQVQIVGIEINNEPLDINILGYRDNETLQTNISITQYPIIQLSHRQNLVTIEFAALDFTNPAQNQYRYQLVRKRTFGKNEGENWVELGGKNSIQFANLQPGSYIFKVLGSNNDGIWNEQPAMLEFTIRPPWWATWWAYLLYILLFGAAMLLFYRYQLRRRLDHQETRRLRELDEFKNRFFTNITHEFRTPLTVILGMSDPLPDAAQPSASTMTEANKRLGLIKRSAGNLLRLINQILDLAKLESNTLKINYVRGDVLPYLRYIAESLHSLANAQNVLLRVESKEPEIVMDYDPERLLQIVYNLLSNAIKFTPSGGRVVLNIGRVQNPADVAILAVTDTGAGIPAEDLPHIFDRFFQANNLEKAKAGGTGIGLSLTKELVKAMGGEISVESDVGKGTTFTVRLPISNKAMAAATTNAPSHRDDIFVAPRQSNGARSVGTVSENSFQHTVPTEREPQPERGATNMPSLRDEMAKAQILLIEDNPDVVEYLSSCLQENYHLDFAYNGRAGIEKALEIVPDLIISDVMMPEKNGFEVCDFLKNDERTSHIPVILLTAKADVESRIAGLRRGADAYLSKPFHRVELLVTLANLLELRRKLQAKYLEIAAQPSVANQQVADSSQQPVVADPEDAFLQKVRAVVEANLSDADFEMPQLERALAMSRSQIFRKIKALTGKSPSQFIRSIRLHHGRRLLQTTNLTVSEIAYDVGFSNVKYFSDAFLEEFGERPTEARA